MARFPARTFDSARREQLTALSQAGWTVKPDLKVPHATSPDGEYRLWFKALSTQWPLSGVYVTEGDCHDFDGARTLYGFDIRQYDGPGFLAVVERLRRM